MAGYAAATPEEDPDALATPEDYAGLDNFDEEQALANLGSVGQPEAQAEPEAPQGGSEPAGPPGPGGAGSTPAPATTDVVVFPPIHPAASQDATLAPPQFAELGPMPPRPAPTGDPAKDIQNLNDWTRALDERHAELERRKGALAEFAASVGQQKGRKEFQAEQVRDEKVAAENARYQQERERRQATIDQAVQARVAANQDLENFKWDRPRTGREIAAIILTGIGNAIAGRPGNEAVAAIDQRMQREYQTKVAKIKSAGDALLAAQYGYKTADENHRAALNALDADWAARFRLIAKDAEDQLAAAGMTKEQIATNMLVTEANQKAADHEQQIHDREEQRTTGREHAKALEDIARANLGERHFEATENRSERRTEFSLRRQDQAEARAERERLEREKREEKKSNADQNLEVRDASGVVRGLAPSSRVVKQVQDRVVQYDDSIKALEDLKAYMEAHPLAGRLPTGDQYNRAVLAVAATTTANSSDATTTHEANTLKNFGLTSPEAVERTLEHQKARQAAFMRQLRPLPGSTGEGKQTRVINGVTYEKVPGGWQKVK